MEVRQAARRKKNSQLDRRLAAYVASAGVVGTALVESAEGVVISDTTERPFGINEEVPIDLNGDGQIDFKIDHDRIDVGGGPLDYLQLDKNDANGASPGEDPLPADFSNGFAVPDGQTANNDHSYFTPGAETGTFPGEYLAALDAGFSIGPASEGVWEFQESDNFLGNGLVRRANRLIDEDAGQVDQALGTAIPSPPPPPAQFVGLGGEEKFLGVRIDLQDQGFTGNPFATVNGFDEETEEFVDDPLNYWYGWIGIRIDNEADATGVVTGFAYESELGMPILAGDTGPVVMGPTGDYNDNGIVDAADYAEWLSRLGENAALPNEDPTATPGEVTIEDYNVWKTSIGNTAGTGSLGDSANVPEPGSLLLSLIAGLTILGCFVARKWRRR